jgi:hypothetical protein
VSIVDQITQNSTAVKRVTTRVAQFALNACRMDSRLAFSHLGVTSDTDIKLRGMPEGWKPDLEWEPAEATKEEAQAMLDRIKVKITDRASACFRSGAVARPPASARDASARCAFVADDDGQLPEKTPQRVAKRLTYYAKKPTICVACNSPSNFPPRYHAA